MSGKRRVYSKKNDMQNTRVMRNIKISNENKLINLKNIVISLTIIVFIIFMILVFIKLTSGPKKNDNLTYNKNKSFVKTQKIDGLIFKNIKCSYDGKNSLITYSVVNNTGKETELSNYNIIVKDKNNVPITKIAVGTGKKIKPKQTEIMTHSIIGADLSDAYSMQLELKKNE
ncbi:MAG: hypothetical protein IKG27_00525 [Bacilli bacterium]|nr:hypothetical protein [Bacilli bacterium]